MAWPPRISNWLPPERETLYFITICVEGRHRVLANEKVWQASLKTIGELLRWEVDAMVLMPDHIHFLAWPHDRDLGVEDFSRGFKYLMTRKLRPSWRWQEGCFDRLLRHDEGVPNQAIPGVAMGGAKAPSAG